MERGICLGEGTGAGLNRHPVEPHEIRLEQVVPVPGHAVHPVAGIHDIKVCRKVVPEILEQRFYQVKDEDGTLRHSDEIGHSLSLSYYQVLHDQDRLKTHLDGLHEFTW